MQQLFLSKRDLEAVQEVLWQFPLVTNFELQTASECSIGSVLFMKFDTCINSVKGTFTVEISGIDTW